MRGRESSRRAPRPVGSGLYRMVEGKRRVAEQIYAFYLRRVLQSLGSSPRIDPSVRIDDPAKVSIGSDVEIRRGAILIGRSDRDTGIEVADGVHIHQYAYLDAYGGFIRLGQGVRIGHHCVIAGHGGVEFGEWSGIAGLSYVIAANHTFRDHGHPFVDQPETKHGIRIGKHVWGGSGVIILDGVSVGDHAVIGAGAVVRKDVAAYEVVLGNPAKAVYAFAPDVVEPEDDEGV